MKKKFYQKKWFIVLMVILAIGIIGGALGGNEETTDTPPTTESQESQAEVNEQKEDVDSTDASKIPAWAETACRAITNIFIENVVEEDYSMLAFNVESFDLDENRNGTINILYLPSNAGDGATKVNLTIVKNGDTYKIEYAMLSGLYEVDLSTVSTEYTEFVIQE